MYSSSGHKEGVREQNQQKKNKFFTDYIFNAFNSQVSVFPVTKTQQYVHYEDKPLFVVVP